MHRIDIHRHRQLEQDGYLYIQKHPSLPLLIHNYAQKAQYERHWVPETLAARGLVTDHEGHVIARPFGKFFNLDEHIGLMGELPAEPFEVYEKMDGSLGILFHYQGQMIVATRGSFESEQAIRAAGIVQRKYAHVAWDPGVTYLFEIIYPENRIVVDYHGMEDIVLLAMMETATGRELPLDQAPPVPLVRRYDGIRDIDALRGLQEDNKEGFVIRFASGLRVKLKFEEYVRLHKVMTGLTARDVWEALREGGSLDAFLENVPDEFYQWVRSVEADLRDAYAAIEAEAKAEFRPFSDRKEAAAYYLGQCKHPAVLFKMLDQRPYDHIIWQMLRPAHITAFSSPDEA